MTRAGTSYGRSRTLPGLPPCTMARFSPPLDVNPPRRRASGTALPGGAEPTDAPRLIRCRTAWADRRPAVPSPRPARFGAFRCLSASFGALRCPSTPPRRVTRLAPTKAPRAERSRKDARMGIRTLRRRTATAATRLSGVRTRLTRASWAGPRVRRPHSLYPWPMTHPVAALLGHVPPYAPRAARPRIPSGPPTRRPVLSGGPSCPPPRRLRAPERQEPGAAP